MSNCMEVVPEQICYIPCNFCNIVLAVSVPCNNLFDMVTVRCGHCANLWSVNMAAAAFHHSISAWQPATPPPDHYLQGANRNSPNEHKMEMMCSSSKGNGNSNNKAMSMRAPATSYVPSRVINNRPPEKRQRVPSAYNQFIKEEIQRIKANNPEISHREAFSAAAKNWAHFPHIHFGLMLESNNQAKLDNGSEKCFMSRSALLNN